MRDMTVVLKYEIPVVYGYGQISIWGGATGSDVSHVTGSDPVRKYVLRNIRSDRRSRDPLEVSLGCSLRRPRPITLGNPASYI